MPHPDRMLARLAHSSHGVVTRAQLLAAGLTLDEIRHRLQSGALLREFRGVYRVGHRAPSVEARYLDARGDGTVRAACAGDQHPPKPITSRGDDLAWHPRDDPCAHAGRPRLSAGRCGPRTACHEAGIRHGTTPGEVEAILATQAGAAKLRRVLRGDEHVSLSALERRFLELLRRAGLPLPITNRPAADALTAAG